MPSSEAEKADIGVIGLGTMGANLALNIAEKGFRVAVFDLDRAAAARLIANADELAERLVPCTTPEELIDAIAPPRAVILLIPAGDPVDAQASLLRPLMRKGDVIVDAGNSDFRDTNRRAELAEHGGPAFLGVAVSGGAEGARHGPSIMAGGPIEAWQRVAPVLRAIAAKHGGEPCAARLGEAGAGHFVKTVHNGIEYADMQMIAEIYGVMRDGLGMDAASVAAAFAGWNVGPLKSYLIEITAEVAAAVDPNTGGAVLDVIVDSAGQKGTGRWTAIEAQHLGAPVSAIEAAVGARNLSALRQQRQIGEDLFGAAPRRLDAAAATTGRLEQALIAGKIICYAQGFDMLGRACETHGWPLPLAEIARIWRAGCIIRSDMLDDMARALDAEPGRNLMFAPVFAEQLKASQQALRDVVVAATAQGLPVPALSASLAYFDAMRTARSTANMLQAQRDFFGAHSFERLDFEGHHHGPWFDDN